MSLPDPIKAIELPVGGIRLEFNASGNGAVTSQLHKKVRLGLERVADGVEALVLAHACAGVNVKDPKYVEGIKTLVDVITNNIA